MISPWQMQMRGVPMMMRAYPLMAVPSGAFPVPQSISPEEFPPAVRESYLRLIEGPPKPSVSLAVMNQTQMSMIAPDLPNKADV